MYQTCHLTVTYCLHMQSAAQQLSLHLWSWNYSAHGSCLTPSFLLQYAAQAEEPYFKEALYSTLVDLKATQQLLKMDSPGLLTYLRDTGGLPEGDATRRGVPIGPLSHRQVTTLINPCATRLSPRCTPKGLHLTLTGCASHSHTGVLLCCARSCLYGLSISHACAPRTSGNSPSHVPGV